MTSKLDHFADLVSKAHHAPWAVSHENFDNVWLRSIPDADRAFIDESRALAEKLIAVARAAKRVTMEWDPSGCAYSTEMERQLIEALQALEASE